MASYPSLRQELETKVTPSAGVRNVVMGNGAVRGRATQSAPSHSMVCVHDNLTLTQLETLQAFLEANKTIAFAWTALESGTVYTRCRFAEISALVHEPRPGRKFRVTTRFTNST